MVTALAETGADLILDVGFLTAVRQEFETRRLDPGYDPSS